MKKTSAFILLFSVAALTVSGQKRLNQKPKQVEWSENPTIHDLPPEYNHESALMLLHDVSLDYRYMGKGVEVYYTQHRLVKVLDDRGIEMFNKVSIPVGSRTRVPLIKARTILPNGKVYEIPKDMIKVTRNEYGQYEIVFAMEGVEKNAEVELLLKEIRSFSLFGSEAFQYQVPVASTHFDISYPKEMVFEEKGYNGFPNAKDVLANNRRHISIEVHDIPALRKEPNSFYDLHRMRAEYRIQKFVDPNDIDTAQIYTWDDLARRIYNEYYTITDKERAAVNKYLVTLGVSNTDKESLKIKKIEDGLKKNIVLYPEMDDEGEVLDSVINNKAASTTGYIRLFAACFAQADVKAELGQAADKREHRFDMKFENWGNLDTYLFYFPGEKKFLSPLSVYYRYPVVPTEVLGTKGVFCSIPPKRDVTSPLVDIRTITPLTAEQNQHNIASGVSFDREMNAQIDIAYSYTGYAAADLRKALLLEPQSKEKELVRKLVTIADKPENLIKYTISKEAIHHTANNSPLEITASVATSDLTEKAGTKYLFKVGELIGPHEGLYNEKERVLPVDMDYATSMNRTITVNLPKGFKVLNADALKMHAEYVDRSLKPVISFNSDYVLKKDKKNGDKLVITVSEYYPQVHFSTNEYDRYRAVVNTAADFYKVSLVLDGKFPPEKKAKKAKLIAKKETTTSPKTTAVVNKAAQPTKSAAQAGPRAAVKPAPAKVNTTESKAKDNGAKAKAVAPKPAEPAPKPKAQEPTKPKENAVKANDNKPKDNGAKPKSDVKWQDPSNGN